MSDSASGRTAALAALAATAAVGFALSFFGVGIAGIPRDAFVLLHLVTTGALLIHYSRAAGLGPAALARRWPVGLLAAAAAAAFSVHFVLSGPPSAGPEGAARLFSVFWLGVVYGALDALLLSVLPVHATLRVAAGSGWTGHRGGKLVTAALALAASALVTAVYHLGFPEFRGAAVIQPVIGNTAFTLAYLVSGSPLAPVLAHVAMHVAAVLHAYGTSVPLPPHS